MILQSLTLEREALLRRNIRLAVILRICLFASAISVPIATKLSEENGISQSVWLLIQVVFNVIMLLVDLPSGHFADRVSRRMALLVGGVFLISGACLYGLSVGFWTMILAEVVLAIGYAFCAGADHALIYESLLELGEEREYERLVPKLTSKEILAAAAFALLGGTIGGWNLRLPYLLEAVIFGSFIVAVFLVVEPRHSGLRKKSFLQALKSARVLSHHPKRLDLQLGLSAICFAGLQTMLWYYQSLFNEQGIPVAWNGIIFLSFHLVAAAAARTSSRFEQLAGGYPKVLYIPLGIVLVVYLLIGLSPIWVVPVLLVLNVARGLNSSLLTAELNRNIPTDVRATLLSLKSFVNRGVYVLLLLIGSAASSVLATNSALLVLALVILLAAATVGTLLRRKAV